MLVTSSDAAGQSRWGRPADDRHRCDDDAPGLVAIVLEDDYSGKCGERDDERDRSDKESSRAMTVTRHDLAELDGPLRT